MWQLQRSKMRLVLIALVLLSLGRGWVSLAACTSPDTGRQVTFHQDISVTSDFDGDNQPDLATSRFEDQTQTVEVQFSTQQKATSLSFASSEFDVRLFACDVDHDHNQDLIVASTRSLQPLAIWLGDGHGHFSSGDRRSGANFLASEDSPGDGLENAEVEQSSSSRNEQHACDRNPGVASATFPIESAAPSTFEEPSSTLPAYQLAARSPPFLLSL